MQQTEKLSAVVPKSVNVIELILLYCYGLSIKKVLLYSFLKLLDFCFHQSTSLP